MSDSSWGRVTGLAGFAWATALGLVPGAVAQTAPSVAPSTPQTPVRVAQLLYPSADESPSIKVMGRGEASMAADRATLTFTIATIDPNAYVSIDPENPEMQELPAEYDVAEIKPLTRAALAPVLSALKKASLSESDLQVELSEGSSEGYVSVTVEKPTSDRLQAISSAVEAALLDSQDVYLSNTKTQFEVRDCQPLEVKAYESAIANARRSATTMAKVLGTSLSGTPRVAESPFDLFSPTSCNETSPLTELMNIGGVFGNAAPPKAEVMIKRDLFVTFPVR